MKNRLSILTRTAVELCLKKQLNDETIKPTSQSPLAKMIARFR